MVDSPEYPVTAPQVRCDTELPGNINPGCIFSGVRPVLVYDSADPNVNQLAAHIRNAQNSGLPGRYPDGLPLSRATDGAIQEANRLIACPQADKAGPPRPAGFECDEYPFAS